MLYFQLLLEATLARPLSEAFGDVCVERERLLFLLHLWKLLHKTGETSDILRGLFVVLRRRVWSRDRGRGRERERERERMK